jgi:hypothetical protein
MGGNHEEVRARAGAGDVLHEIPAKFTKAIVGIVAALSILVGMQSFGTLTMAHSWYPKECCGGADCAPADAVVRRSDGSYLVSIRDMSVLIPRDYEGWQRSPDGRIHVCVSEYVVFCAFRGPAV